MNIPEVTLRCSDVYKRQVEIDVPILGRKVIDDLAVRPKVHADIPIARHSVHLLRWAVARFPGRPYQNGSSPSSSLTSAKSPP